MSSRVYRLLTHSWGIGIGVLALAACLAFFLLPDRLAGNVAVETQLGGWDDLYYGAYGVAGVTILAGLIGRRAYLESFGLCLFLAGLCVNLAALIETFGLLHTVDAWGAWFAYALGATGRLLVVSKLVREQITLEEFETGVGK